MYDFLILGHEQMDEKTDEEGIRGSDMPRLQPTPLTLARAVKTSTITLPSLLIVWLAAVSSRLRLIHIVDCTYVPVTPCNDLGRNTTPQSDQQERPCSPTLQPQG